MKVGIVGCGYVGLVTGVGLASKGNKVIAIDIDPSRVECLKKGIVPFHEPGVAKALRLYLKKGGFTISSLIDDIANCEIVIICVQTPPLSSGVINLQILKFALQKLALVFEKNPKKRAVVVKSTVIPGTTDALVTPMFKAVSALTEVAFNPEFLREGSAWDDFINPDRIVIGTHSIRAIKQLKKLYRPFNAPIIITTPSTSELAKYASNTLLSTLISFSNEIARICEQTPDTDVEDVLGITHLDRRFVPEGKTALGILSYLKAGCGFGGSCFPKDLSALIAYAHSKGESSPLLKAVAAINYSQPIRVVDMAADALGRLDKHYITVLGAAFKGGTDDLRESPGLRIVDELLKRKALITIYDPLVNGANLKNYQDKGVIIASTLKMAVRKAEVCIISSNAPEFQKLKHWGKFAKNLIVIDGRRILKSSIGENGYYAIGRSISK